MYQSGVVSVGTTATLIVTTGVESDVLINNGGSATIYLGGPSVTSTTGFPVAAGATVTVPNSDDEARDLYAVIASGTANVAFIHPVQ